MPLTRAQRRKVESKQSTAGEQTVDSVRSSADQSAPASIDQSTVGESGNTHDVGSTAMQQTEQPKEATSLSNEEQTTSLATDDTMNEEEAEKSGNPINDDNDDDEDDEDDNASASEDDSGSEDEGSSASENESDSDGSNESESEGEDEDEDEEEEEEEDEDEDLDALLEKASTALKAQQLEKESEKDEIRMPKLQTGMSYNDQLYITKDEGRAKLVDSAIAIEGEKTEDGRRLETLKAGEEKKKKLSKKERRLEREKTAGKGWFDMPKQEITPEIKHDLDILRMRHVLDPKRHYRSLGKHEFKYFQVGTIKEGPTEFFSSRVARKDRGKTIVDELLADNQAREYHKRKANEINERGMKNGRRKTKKKRHH